MWLPGVLVAAAAALLAWGVHALVPALPLLTVAVVLGIAVGQVPAFRVWLTGTLAPGLSLARTRFMRLGIVLLGLKLSLGDIADLGWLTVGSTVAIVLLTFAGTLWLGRLFRLPGDQPLLIATGFSICGASAIGAMSGVVKAKDDDTATSIALVTLCGTLAIAVLPALWHPLGLSALQFGQWVGAGVHDVGQVVATAQIAGSAALSLAVVIKVTRVLMLAPIVAVASVVERRRPVPGGIATIGLRSRPPIMPLFVAGFLAAVLLNSAVALPVGLLSAADSVQNALLAMALFALGAAVRLVPLLRTGWRALLVGLLSWTLIAILALGAVQLA
ncbi:putative sulfate exporter family transporter [Cryobacterium sp. CG_9.6]|uniref:YeiH family protein n=1 Tax=Cryobacterium sp. CG_9.6 TaxID=2760710 RepID=UPI00247394C5|nr:putative sulfate exporter family transporter [Cryobacterium sp. CG_9.6]MDH6237631.1 putative integral membrane protein (TIGR00698 family) [Cryobacterium sp. CG_9.6]